MNEDDEWKWLQNMLQHEEARGELPPNGATGGAVALSCEQIKQIRWCRARVMTALACMIEQGKLEEVLNELPIDWTTNLSDPKDWIFEIEHALRDTGWMK